MNVLDAIAGRRSVRRFLATPVPEETIRAILEVAARAPSGTNSQPWHVTVVTGEARQRVCDAVTEAAKAGRRTPEYDYAPQPWPDVYRARARKIGFDLYALYGVKREDMAGRAAAGLRNFTFFGAPVGLFFIIDTGMGHGQWAHLGMFMQSVALAATERGVGTCLQEAWARMRAPLHAHFALAPNEMIYCGMALGHADMTKPVNTLRSDRASVDEIASFRGF